MITPNTLHRFLTLCLLALCTFSELHAATEHALYIDGKVRTDGVPLDGTRVVVERDGLVIQVQTGPVGRMFMRLELQRTYVLSFERTGCLTKRLLFDTHVPLDDLEHAPFTFPYKVTLQKNEEADVLHYAQPVGFIRFYADKHDFDYDTNYKMRRDQQEREDRMKRDPSIAEENARAIELVDRMMAEDRSRTLDRPASGSFTRAARTAGEENSLGFASAARMPPPIAPFIPADHSEAVHPPVARSMPAVHRPEGNLKRPVVDHRPGSPGAVTTRPPRPAPVVPPDGRTEELVVEKNRVATIIRITEDGRTREYRRIAQGYGDVHYFCDGYSCSGSTYSSAILQK